MTYCSTKPCLELLQRWRIVIIARLQVLCFYNLNALFGFDTFKNDVCIYPFCNGCIATGFVIRIKAVWVNSFPKGFIVKRVEPLLQILSVFELLHVSSLSQLGFGQEVKSTDRSTMIAVRLEMPKKPQSSCLHGAVEFERSTKCLLR